MDRLDIKDIWKQQKDQGSEIADQEVDGILMNKTETFLDKIKRNARVEHYANIVVSVALVIYLAIAGRWVLLGISSIGMSLLVNFFWRLYRNLWRIEASDNTKEFLVKLLAELNRFTRRYIYGLLVILPFSVLFGVTLKGDGLSINRLLEADTLIFLSVTLISIMAIVYLIFNRMYGQYIKKLKEMLTSLNEE